MFPNFGVGVKRYLFEQSGSPNLVQLESKILSQVSIWAPYIKIENIDISFLDNQMSIRIKYLVPSADISDVLNLDINL